jgi:uncharacterized alpha-E superfamily protein
MEGIDERYLNVARQIRDRLSERHWSEVVDVSRTMTMDSMSLDDVPAVALAFCRATMLSLSIESGSAFIREQMHVWSRAEAARGLHARHDRLALDMLAMVEPIVRIAHLVRDIESATTGSGG